MDSHSEEVVFKCLKEGGAVVVCYLDLQVPSLFLVLQVATIDAFCIALHVMNS